MGRARFSGDDPKLNPKVDPKRDPKVDLCSVIAQLEAYEQVKKEINSGRATRILCRR